MMSGNCGGEPLPRDLQFLGSVLLMIAATSLWAVAFVVPVLVPDASALNIMLGRYLVYGICSAAVVYRNRIGVLRIKRRDWALALGFAIFGNLLYYFVLTLGIQIAGPRLAVPIIGLLPVTVSLFGNLRSRDLPFRTLALPLSAVLIGLLLVNVSRGGGDARFSFLGIACLVLPVAMWTWYAVANAAFLKRRADVSASEWASVIGVATLALTVPLLAAGFWFGSLAQSVARLVATGQLAAFCAWSVVLGAGTSWGAAVLFNKASAQAHRAYGVHPGHTWHLAFHPGTPSQGGRKG